MNTNENIDINEEEVIAAKMEAKNSPDVFTINFKTPIPYNEKEYASLTFDFGSLTSSFQTEFHVMEFFCIMLFVLACMCFFQILL